MSALMKRLERGIAAIKQGDRDTAENILDEVAAEPGSVEPIAGLLEDTEKRFYELRARLSGEEVGDEVALDGSENALDGEEEDWDQDWDQDEGEFENALEAATEDEFEDEQDHWDEGGRDIVVTARDYDADKRLALSMEYYDEDALVEVERHEETFRELEIGAGETRDTVVTVQSYNSSITLPPHAELPDVVAQHLPHDIEPGREWAELHVEEMRVLKTTLVYKDEPQYLALPCACQE